MNAALIPRLREENGPMERKNKGTSFDSWLDEEGIGEEVTAAVLERVLARRTAAAMKRDGIGRCAPAAAFPTACRTRKTGPSEISSPRFIAVLPRSSVCDSAWT